MDFDKQFGNMNSVPMETRGRGFNEKPMSVPESVPRQNHSRNPREKVTLNTQLYSSISHILSR